jgi:hypothetical protein
VKYCVRGGLLLLAGWLLRGASCQAAVVVFVVRGAGESQEDHHKKYYKKIRTIACSALGE